jgi:hypothetical protein
MADHVMEYDDDAATANSGSGFNDDADDDEAFSQCSISDGEDTDDFIHCTRGGKPSYHPRFPRYIWHPPTIPEEGVDIALRMFRLIEQHKHHCALLMGHRKHLPAPIPTNMIRIIRIFASRVQLFPPEPDIDRDSWPYRLCHALHGPGIDLHHVEKVVFWRKFEKRTLNLLKRLNRTNPIRME